MSKTNSILPILENTKNQNPFKVPDGYFNQLPGKLTERAVGATKPQNKIVRFNYQTIMSVAAACITLMVAIKVFVGPQSSSKAELNNEMVNAYESSVKEELNDLELASKIEKIQTEETEQLLEAESQDELSKQMIDYLVQENVDIHNLEESL